MSSPEKIIADAFNTEIVGHSGDYNGGRLTYSRSLDLALQGLAALRGARYAIVQLPEADQNDEDGIGWCNGHLSDWGVYVARDVPDGKVYDQNDGVTPRDARTIASWWLAAADTAEDNQ